MLICVTGVFVDITTVYSVVHFVYLLVKSVSNDHFYGEGSLVNL